MIAWQSACQARNGTRLGADTLRLEDRREAPEIVAGAGDLPVGRGPAVGRQVGLTDPARVVETGTDRAGGEPSPPSISRPAGRSS